MDSEVSVILLLLLPVLLSFIIIIHSFIHWSTIHYKKRRSGLHIPVGQHYIYKKRLTDQIRSSQKKLEIILQFSN